MIYYGWGRVRALLLYYWLYWVDLSGKCINLYNDLYELTPNMDPDSGLWEFTTLYGGMGFCQVKFIHEIVGTLSVEGDRVNQ